MRATATARDLMAIMARVTWGAEPDDVSMLHAVRYVKAAGGLDRMLDTTGGAQEEVFPAGTQQIAKKMAAELGDRVRLNSIVTRIEWSDHAVAVSSSSGTVDARRVIVAVPPAHRLNIDIAPAPPIGYQQLAQSWPQGALSKAYAAYERPFWRTAGHSGEALSDQGPVFITFDCSPSDDGPGILLGFADARNFDALPPERRKELALEGFSALFGDEAKHPIDYLDHSWGAESFAPGGPTAAVPPGSWTEFGPLLRQPVGPLHWAGTETADKWTGFLDGAVRSGQRAAAEVAAALKN
jgi:monoamine oxidase